jgi:DNA-binding CsgD family transcriptional regulator
MEIANNTQKSRKPLLTDREVELLRLMRERDGWSYNRLAVVFEVSKVYVQMVCTYRRR